MDPLDTEPTPRKRFREVFVPVGLAVLAIYITFVVAWIIFALTDTDPLVHREDPRTFCINNLRQIDGAKQQWALEHHAPTNAIPTWSNIQPYLGRGTGGTLPTCPQGGIYKIGSLTNAPTCSIKDHALN